jgi:protein O-GlcNAc transferase
LANYATLLARRGEIERAVPLLRKSVESEPAEPVPHSTLCMYLNALPNVSPRETFDEHRKWAASHAPSPGKPGEGRGEGKIRIGYVSPDWAGHPVARFMQPILESHDRSAFEIHIYDDAPRPDAFTDRLRPFADAWDRVRGMPDEQLAEKIRADRIDILIDLAGHTAGNRLLVFASKPAPVQMSYLGYPNTTGLTAIDYRLTDAIADPPGLADELHTEKLLRLPGTFLAFRPPVETPAVVEPPLLTNGFVTFGSFNALWKINGPLLKLWARVLSAVPGSRMVLKADSLDDPAVAQRFANVFAEAGIDANRLQLLGREATYGGHLAAYGGCDVCLDSFPYAGTTTTCEALWMGVPVVSLAGQVHAARVGASLLSSVGLPELVANDPDNYVAIAATLATQPDRLRELRLGMRDRMRSSPLMDAVSLTRAIEAAYRTAASSRC